MPSATSPARSSAALARPLCTSVQAHAGDADAVQAELHLLADQRAAAGAVDVDPARRAAIASAARSTSPRSSSAAVSCMARVSAAMIWPSTRSSGSVGWISRPMSTVQPAERARPVSAAMPSRRSAYPSKPSARQKRVTVAGEVPLRSASSTIVARAAPAGSVSTCSATRCSAPVNSGSSERTRTRTPSERAPGGRSRTRRRRPRSPRRVSTSRSTIGPHLSERVLTVSGKSSY